MIKRITYKEKEYPVWLCYEVLEGLQNDTKSGLQQMQEDVSLYRPLLYYSIKAGCEEEGVKAKFEHKKTAYLVDGVDITKILNHVYFEFVAMIPDFFPSVEKMMGVGTKTETPLPKKG